MTKALMAIGLMSGTSMDGVDVAMITSDGETIEAFGPTGGRPYTVAERETIAAAVAAAASITDRKDRRGILAEAERVVTDAHAETVEAFLTETAMRPDDIGVVGFHGQTILHRPQQRLTVQLGDGAALARRLGIDVVYDFRAADVAAGGQGAPLVPAFHQALVARGGFELPVAVLNLGGVGNVSFVGERAPLAFDTGPGNALIDDWVRARAGAAFDDGGRLAAAGAIDEAVLGRLLDHPYFAAPPPKSLDRNDFRADAAAGLSTEDGAATLAAFTAATAARAADWFPAPAKRWIVAGGGARNAAILAELARRLAVPVSTADAVGWSAEHLEAQAFAYLAVRSLRGLPLTFPTTTGVVKPMRGGVLAQAVS